MDQLLSTLLKSGGPLGIFAAVIIVMVVVSVYLRQKGFGVGSKDKIFAHEQLSSIDSKLGKIDRRLSDVEFDLRNRPTRSEVHDLEISVAQMDERLKSIDRGVQATSEAVTSINTFMREAALRIKGGK